MGKGGKKRKNVFIRCMFDRKGWKRQQQSCVVKRRDTDYPLHSPGILNSHTKNCNNASYKHSHIHFPHSGTELCSEWLFFRWKYLPPRTVPAFGKYVSGGKRKHLTNLQLHLQLYNQRKFPRCCRQTPGHPGGIYESFIWLFYHSSTVSFTQLMWLAVLAFGGGFS